MKNNKRAFTIVELVIVIAVIGILAAVLIPTFSSLIEKANMNSDEAAVKSMNTYLSADEQINGKPATWQDAVKVLSKSNLDAQNYRALSSEHQLVWDATVNRVLYVEKKTQLVVYPEEYTADGMLDLGYQYGQWTTLEGKMVADDSWRYNVTTNFNDYVSVNNGEVVYKDATLGNLSGAELEEFINDKTESGDYVDYFGGNKAANLAAMEYKNNAEIKSGLAEFTVGSEKFYISKVEKGEQLVSFTDYVQQPAQNNGKNYTLVLTDDIDLNSTQWKPIETYAGNIDGGKEQATIKNFTMSDRTAEVKMYSASTDGGSYFYYGFISVFTGNYLGNLNFEGQDVENPGVGVTAPQGFKKTGHAVGVLAGLVYNGDNEDVLIENITVGAGTLTGMSRVGGVVCQVGGTATDAMEGGSITFKNIVNNANVVTTASVNASHSTAGGIASMLYNVCGGKISFVDCVNNGSVTGVFAGGLLANIGASGAAGAIDPYEVEFIKCTNNGQINGVVCDKYYDGKNINEDVFGKGAYAGGFVAVTDSTTCPKKFVGCVNNGVITLTNNYDTDNAKNTNWDKKFYAMSFIQEGTNATFEDYKDGEVEIKTAAKNEFKYEIKHGTAVEVKYPAA